MTTPGYQRFFAELKRRRVFRVMAVYGIVGFILLQIVDLLVPALLLPEWVYRFVALILLLGFPVAIVLAWAFESTPDGIKRTEEAAPGELGAILAAPASQRWPAGVAALVGVTALLAGVWYLGRQSAPGSSSELASGPVAASIAVLPFADMSPDGDQEYFSDGISEELLNLLAKIPELQVAARTSSFSFKDQNLEIPEIARRLDVAHVLEGSVRKANNDVRVTAQLIRADDGFHVWSETWDRSLDDIFAIQDEIAADVVEQLQIELLGKPPTVEVVDPEAYALYLQAKHLGRRFTPKDFEESNALYRAALEIEPDYADAWVGLAGNYAFQAGAFGSVPTNEAFATARDAATRALSIDPDHALAHAVMGMIADIHDQDLAAAASHTEKAFALDPSNLDVVFQAVDILGNLGRWDDALALSEYGVARDPVNSFMHLSLGVGKGKSGRVAEAVESYRTAVSLNPSSGLLHYLLGRALLLNGEPEQALEAMQEETETGWRLQGLAMAYHELGRVEDSDTTLARFIDELGDKWAINIAQVYAVRGEVDPAFEWLERAIEINDPGLSSAHSIGTLVNLHDDPRWLPFLRRIGRAPEDISAIEFEVRLPQ